MDETELVRLTRALQAAHAWVTAVREELEVARQAADLARERMNAAFSDENVARSALMRFLGVQ